MVGRDFQILYRGLEFVSLESDMMDLYKCEKEEILVLWFLINNQFQSLTPRNSAKRE